MLTRKLRVFLLAVIFCHPVWGQPDSLALPASITGTWQLTFEDAQSGSPITNGVSVDMTLNSNGAVCVADLLLIQPVVAQGNAVWRLPEMGLELHLHGLDGNTAPQAVLRSAGGDYLGRFKTEKLNNSTVCQFLGHVPENLDLLYELFSLAQSLYPELFPSGYEPVSFIIMDGFVYRPYSSTGILVAIREGQLYTQGAGFGEQLQNQGNMLAVLEILRNEANPVAPIDPVNPNSPCPARVFCPHALVDPGTGSWQVVPSGSVADVCRLDEGILKGIPTATTSAFAIVRYGRLCFVSGDNGSDGPIAGQMWSATKTLGAILTGMTMYETRHIPASDQARRGPLREFDRMDKWIDLSALPSSASINRDATVAHVLAMVGYSADLSHGSKQHQYDATGNREINYLVNVINNVVLQDTTQFGSSAADVKNRLFARLGLQHSTWSAQIFGYSWVGSLQDMARVGLLMLNGGIYNGERVLDAQYVYNMTHPAFEDGSTSYGYLTWLSPLGCAPRAIHRTYPHGLSGATSCGLPGGCQQQHDVGVWFAAGAQGQYIVGHRGLDMVIVARNWISVGDIWQKVLPAVVARDPVYQGDHSAFCAAYGAGDYAPDLRLWEGSL